MKFTISKDQYERLFALAKTVQTISDISIKSGAYIFKAENDKLYCIINGNGNTIKFSIDISDYIANPNDSTFFSADISTFLTALEKTLKNSDKTEVSLNGTKLIVSSGKNVITNNLKNQLDVADFEEADNKISAKLKQFDNITLLQVTDEIVDFANVVGKFIPMVGSDRVTGMAVQGNKIQYSDQAFSIIDRTLSDVCTSEDGNGGYLKKFIPQALFNFLTTVKKQSGKLEIEYSGSDDLMHINLTNIGLEAILQMPSVVCEYPDEDGLAGFKPDPASNYSFEISKEEFLNKLDLFDGVFSSANWKWKTVNFTLKADDTVELEHNDLNSEVDTDLVVKVLNKTASGDLSFKIPGLFLIEYLNKLVDVDTIKLTVSPISPEEEHGAGLVIDVPNTSIVLSKLLDEEVF